MFDILLYLYDTYLLTDHFPPPEQLSRKLSAAGFEDEEIGEALEWLAALDDLAVEDDGERPPTTRVYSVEEMTRLDVEGRGFLAWLEGAGVLPARAREWVIERALALGEAEIEADRVKWIALLALWKLRGPGDVLWLEDLVRGAEDDWQPTLH
jgi:Smg protein